MNILNQVTSVDGCLNYLARSSPVLIGGLEQARLIKRRVFWYLEFLTMDRARNSGDSQ
jgi:hypothetical protein